MLDPKEIDKALEAHAAWKERLRTAIESGKIETSVTTIAADNQCAFGKWLYGGTLTAEDKGSAQYKEIIRLHGEFHKVAAKVATLATSGMKAEAQKMIEFGNEYAQISGQLSLALKRWKETMKPVAAK